MPMHGNMYNYTEGNESYYLPDGWGGFCHSWEADMSSSGFVAGWGCSSADLALVSEPGTNWVLRLGGGWVGGLPVTFSDSFKQGKGR